MRIHPLLLSLPLLCASLMGRADALGTPAGTSITNVASAHAEGDSGPVDEASNTVSTTVAGVCALSITPDGTPAAPGQLVNVLPGERGLLAYTIRNVGNQQNTYNLSALADGSSTFTPGSLNIYADAAGTGATLSSLTLDVDGSATLYLAVQSASADRGHALVSLNASCADGSGTADLNNYGELSLDTPPGLSLSKSFSPALVKPGDLSTVTLTASNGGQGASREVIVADALNTPDLAGSSYAPGSASGSAGVVEYSADGGSWQATEPASVAAIRLRVPSLAAGATATLTFKLATSAAAENKTLKNLATLASSGTPGAQASASLDVRYSPGVALGPVGNPQAPEATASDTQRQDLGAVGQPTCFTQSLENTGDVADDYTLTPTVQSGQTDVTLKDASGQPLSQPVHLDPGQRVNIQVCLTPTAAGAVQVSLTASGTRGTTNATTDQIGTVEVRLPALQKTVDPVGQVTAGQTLTYTLSVQNPYTSPLTNVTVRDPLDPQLTFVAASDGGQLQNGAVTWQVGTLAPGETRRLTLSATVTSGARDGDLIKNTFAFTSDQFQTPLPSPTALSPVWSAALSVTKNVDQPEAGVGDQLTYTVTIRNGSVAGTLNPLTVTDTLPAGTSYVPGTAHLDGQPIADPQVSGRTLTWTLGALAPQSQITLTYGVRIEAGTEGDLVNVVQVRGQASNSAVIASNVAKARIRLRLGMFAPRSQLIGRVFVDRNRDGVYQSELDTPVERARIVLADGRLTLSDAEGRYHFADVQEGFTALRLDPASVPYEALSLPQDGGRPGSRGVVARGLTSVDFPLAALMGEIGAIRETTLHAGPLTLAKRVTVEDGHYAVTLTLSSAAATPALRLSDPLPAGAQLTSGQNVLELPGLAAGSVTLSYTFDFGGLTEAAVTDPTVTWRNP